MKKIISAISLAGLLVLGSCNVLDLAPIDYNAAGSYWQNAAQVETYLNGLMGQIRSDYRSPFVLGELRGSAMKEGASLEGVSLNYADLVMNRLSKDVTGVSDWNGYYSKLLQVNHYIDQVENYCEVLTDAERNLFLAPAYGIRAYFYFMLYRTYGGVPIETTVKIMEGKVEITDLYKARATAEETLAFIKEDVGKSEACYGSDRTLDRHAWSYFATEMLKAQVYLWSAKVTTGNHAAAGAADLATAKTALENIVSSGKFGLLSNFGDIFSYTNKGNKEEIFAIYFNNTETTNNAPSFIFQAALTVGALYDEDGNNLGDPLNLCGTGMHRVEYREALIRSIDKTDARRAATFFEAYDSPNPATRNYGSCVIKYMGHVEDGSRYYDSDVIVYRYADVLLMLAEIENSQGNAAAAAGYINQIRKRAYGSHYTSAVEFKAADFAKTELAILKERDKEFVAEGTRWFDLIRLQDAAKKPLVYSAAAAYPMNYGEAAVAVLRESESHKLLWPINAAVLAADPELEQTPGY